MTNRDSQIVHLLNLCGELSIQRLSELLAVSPSTVRRDLSALEECHLVERTRGGARLSSVIRYSPLPIYKLPIDPEEERAIANEAVQLVRRRDVIGVSGGRICTRLALFLRSLEGITVVTNAVNIAAELVALPGIRVMLTGGQLNQQSFELVGPTVSLSLENVHINKFFLGTDGLSVEHGVTGHDEAEAVAARAIMEHADRTIVLADSSKFKQANFARVAPLSDVAAIVTTGRVPQEVRKDFEKAGVQVIVAPLADKPCHPRQAA